MRCAQRMRMGAFCIALAAALTLSSADAESVRSPRLKPPPPGPAFTSVSDLAQLEAVQEAIDRRDWSRARALPSTLSSPMAQSLAEWLYLYAEDPLLSIERADAFLDSHPDWPALSKIQIHAEGRMTTSLAPATILDFFQTRDPLTGGGSLHLARALTATGARDAAALKIREAWVHQNFPVADEQRLLSQFGGALSAEDHTARADRLLWSREVTAARRVFSRLDSTERRKAEARAALLLAAANGPALYDSLDDELRTDSGVMLAAVRYYRRAGEEPRAVSIARLAPTEPLILRNPSRWWEERQLLMRWALTERQYADAYAMASGHGLDPGSSDFAEAEFNAGWIALRFLGAPERAEIHFSALAANVGTPISLSRAYYWLGRAAEARGERELATGRYGQAAEHIYTYYGQLAAEKIGGVAAARGFAAPIEPTPEDKARFSSRPAVAALRILTDLRADRPFLIFAYHVDDELETPGEYVELMRLADRVGATHVTVRAGKVGIGRGAFAPEVAYPLVAVPESASRFAPREVILGLSRQESEFNPRAYSSAGARGLMQLIPSTAQITARKEGLPYDRSGLLDDPAYNMMIGSAHLSHLLKGYNGSMIMTFAAYNAGPHRVTSWIERYGDPRSDDVDPIDWVEQIPFSETRNYVQRVLENTQVYRGRLDEAPIAGRLAGDLEVGGARGRAGGVAGMPNGGVLPPVPERTIRFAASGAHAPLAPAETTAAADPAPAGANGANDVLVTPPPAAADAPPPEERRRREPKTKKPATPTRPVAAMRPGEAHPTDESAAALNAAALAGLDAPQPSAGEEAPPVPILGALIESNAEADDPRDEECRTYSEYIAETEQDAAAAGDLNAGALAEFKSGGPSC